MRGLAVWGALFVAATGACGSVDGTDPGAEPTAQTASAIQGGADDATHNFVVAIIVNNTANGDVELCTGVLLAPNLVATARHCVVDMPSLEIDCTTAVFGAAFDPSQFVVTNAPSVIQADEAGNEKHQVSQVIVPTGSGTDAVCGNDIGFLVLADNIELSSSSDYVVPVIDPPMTASTSRTFTAIGYGEDSPTDDASAGTRRIRENIMLNCISNDSGNASGLPDCLADSANKNVLTATEFEGAEGTCEGDSGGSAFDQGQVNEGKWASFGVLSRGSASASSTTCAGAVYTRFDAWGALATSAAKQAAQAGGYSVPSWATGEGTTTPLSSPPSSSGCSVGAIRGDSTPWRTAALALGVVALAFGRLRRRR